MSEKHHPETVSRKRPQRDNAGTEQRKSGAIVHNDQRRLPPTNDAGDGISEGTLRDASGSETGGGIDTPVHAEKSTEATIHKQQPLHQGTSAYTGGGSDNGSNL